MRAISADCGRDFGEIDDISFDSSDCSHFYDDSSVFNASNRQLERFLSSPFSTNSNIEIEKQMNRVILDVHTKPRRRCGGKKLFQPPLLEILRGSITAIFDGLIFLGDLVGDDSVMFIQNRNRLKLQDHCDLKRKNRGYFL